LLSTGTFDLTHAAYSPDFGAQACCVFAERLGVELANIDKLRDLQTGKVTARFAGGDITGKTCIVTDDCINTGSTIVEVARVLKEQGASKVIFYATHALLAGKASELLQKSEVDEVVVSDTVAIPSAKQFKKLRVISVVPAFAQALQSMI
jgi:ribose-phosphate pyrophosphokinase